MKGLRSWPRRSAMPGECGRRSWVAGPRLRRALLMLVLVLTAIVLPCTAVAGELRLVDGTPVPEGQLEAVGELPGCTATLIGDSLVLTAAHCVCPTNDSLVGCAQRARFTLRNVFPADNPRTSNDESRRRADVSIDGDVRVHPEFGQRGWLREDIAVVELDRPASEVTRGVRPLAVEDPERTPLPGDVLTFVGFGRTGADCSGPPQGKRWRALPVDISEWGRIFFKPRAICPGDSGGPLLNKAGRVVGVTSWHGMDSTFRPTSYSYNWIFGLEDACWGSCSWVGVARAGLNSHQPGPAWCADGSFLTALDLDGDRRLSGHDAPVIGQARCCDLDGARPSRWGTCTWVKVEQAGLNSHRPFQQWCPNGSYITQIDLDADSSASANDSPVVGQVRCCTIAGGASRRWGSSYWRPVETWVDGKLTGIDSHQAGESWCEDGAFLTQLDLDGIGGLGHDAPVVGQAKCSEPRP